MNISSLGSLLAEDNWQNQYTDTGAVGAIVTLILVAFILGNIYRATSHGKKGKELYIRRIAGLNAIDEAVGRATELGRPVVMVPGIATNVDAIVMQALKIFSYVARISANFNNPILVCCGGAPVYAVAQEIIRDVYQREGLGDRFDPDSVRFISDKQFALAAGVAGIILREKAAATFFMGDFFAESLIFAETANSVGAIQIASSTQVTQTPFFIAACDYVLIGDEFYAASAYLSRAPLLVGSLIGQDWAKMLVCALVLLGVLINSIQLGPFTGAQILKEKADSAWKDIPARNVKLSDTFTSHLFTPQDDPSLKDRIHRETYDKSDLPRPDTDATPAPGAGS